MNEPCNTHAISLLPIMSMVCERAAHSQFVNFLDKNEKISKQQSGSRSFHSTKTALLYFTDEILKNMDKKNISMIILLEIAYVTIWCCQNFRVLVCQMLRATGLGATFHNEAKLLKWPIPSLTPSPWLWTYHKAQYCMLMSELTVHMLKCNVRGHVCCPLIHDLHFISCQFSDQFYSYCL